MGDRLRYSASDCFETFPFPHPDPKSVIHELETLGEALYTSRAYMLDTDQGLTKTYNALKDPTNTDPRILALRAQHEHLDAAVLAAYGWSDIPVPPYCATAPDHPAALTAFEDEIIDRLFLLNEARFKSEAALGRATQPKKSKPAKRAASPRPAAATPERPRAKRGRRTPPPDGQGSLGLD